MTPLPALARLQIVKIIHTVVWALLVAAIVAIPVLAWVGLFDAISILAALVSVEGIVLVVNGGRCPLTDLAARYTDRRDDNFDIYLPRRLARHGKVVFGGLFAVVMLFASALWTLEQSSPH